MEVRMTLESISLEYQKPKQKYFDEMYMQLAVNMSKLSTCSRVQVGAVLVVEDRPLLSGYNGSPKGHEHCIDIYQAKFEEFKDSNLYNDETFEDFMKLPNIREEHGRFSRLHEIHAEINIISQAAYKGLATKGGKLYITHSPCNDCCKSILTAGIKEIVFKELYDRETEGLEILAKSNVLIRQLKMEDRDIKENIQWVQTM
jgi:dCMP deaminase